MRFRSALLLVLFTFVSTMAHADAVKPWVSGTLGFSSLAMNDVNADIGNVNLALLNNGVAAQMNRIGNGLDVTASGGIDFSHGMGVGLEYEHLSAKSEASDPTGSITYAVPASILSIIGRYRFESTGPVHGFAQVGVGRLMPSASVTLTSVGVGSVTRDLEGSGFAFQGSGGLEYSTGSPVSISGILGYRHAVASDVKLNGAPMTTASGGSYAIDYSGIFLRGGLNIAFGH